MLLATTLANVDGKLSEHEVEFRRAGERSPQLEVEDAYLTTETVLVDVKTPEATRLTLDGISGGGRTHIDTIPVDEGQHAITLSDLEPGLYRVSVDSRGETISDVFEVISASAAETS